MSQQANLHCVLFVGGQRDEVECAVVTLTPELVDLCLKRIARFEGLKAQDDQLYELRFWHGSPRFLATDDSFEGLTDIEDEEEVTPHVFDGNFAIVRNLPAIPESHYARVELIRMVVSDQGVKWAAWTKHTDHAVDTDHIPKGTLEAISEGRIA